jgi:hypothetical protein
LASHPSGGKAPIHVRRAHKGVGIRAVPFHFFIGICKRTFVSLFMHRLSSTIDGGHRLGLSFPPLISGCITSEIIPRESLTDERLRRLALYAGRKQSFRLCKILNIGAHAVHSVDTWDPQKSAEPESWQWFAINRLWDANEPGMARWLLHKLHVGNPPAAGRVTENKERGTFLNSGNQS